MVKGGLRSKASSMGVKTYLMRLTDFNKIKNFYERKITMKKFLSILLVLNLVLSLCKHVHASFPAPSASFLKHGRIISLKTYYVNRY